MTRLPIPNGRQLTLRLSQNGQDAAIVFGFTSTGPGPTETSAADARDGVWSNLRPLILSSVVLTGAVLRDVSMVDGPSVEVGTMPGTGNSVGAAGGTESIAAACTLIRWSTNGGGRSGRGRTYLPGLATVSVAPDGRTYTSAYETTVATQIAAMLASTKFASAGVTPAILSFTKGTARPIVAGSLSPVVGVQRRRMR